VSTRFERVTIVGVGLIGGSLGLALRRGKLSRSVVGVGHRQVSIDRALALGAVDEGTLDVLTGVRDADLVVLATAIGLICEMGERIAPVLKPGCLVTDVGSTKSEIVRRLSAALPDGVHFVGAHPIAGSEKRGIDAAEVDLFRGARCVLTPTDDTPPGAVDRVRGLWESVGAVVSTLTPDAHDAILARTSHLPHVVAAMLVASLDAADDNFVGPGIRDTTRVASGDVNLWCDILLTNREAVLRAADGFTGRLTELGDALRTGDRGKLARLLDAARTRRNALWPDGSSHE